MKARSEQEREVYLFDGPGRGLWGQVHRDAQGLEHVGAARLGGDGAVAVLGHRNARRRAHQRHRGGDIEGVEPVAARAADVQDFPRLPERLAQGYCHRTVAQLTRQGSHLGRSFATNSPGDEKIGPLAHGLSGVSQSVNQSGHSFRAQFLAGGHRAGKFAEHGDRLMGLPAPGQPATGVGNGGGSRGGFTIPMSRPDHGGTPKPRSASTSAVLCFGLLWEGCRVEGVLDIRIRKSSPQLRFTVGAGIPLGTASEPVG